MLPPLGFHDSCVDALEHHDNTLTLHLSDVQELAPGVPSWACISTDELFNGSEKWRKASVILRFEGVRNIFIDQKSANRIAPEPGGDGDLYSLDEDAGKVSMFIYWHYYQPHRSVPKSYALTCDSIQWEHTSTPL
jgi:hypothetical protein